MTTSAFRLLLTLLLTLGIFTSEGNNNNNNNVTVLNACALLYFRLNWLTSAETDAPNEDMINWALVILAVNFCTDDVFATYTSDVVSVTTTQIQDQKNSVTFGGRVQDSTPTYTGTGSDDVERTTVDDVSASCRSMCPANCSCGHKDGQEASTYLFISCRNTRQFNQSALSRLTQEIIQLLLRCGAELTELWIMGSPLTTVPEVICALSKLQTLILTGNRLVSLPNNCFTRMLNLTTFSASHNRLTSLQVRYMM